MGSTTLTCDDTNYDDVFLAKIDPSSGTVISASSYKGTTGSGTSSYDAQASAVTSDSSSMIYIAGTYTASTMVLGSTTITNTASGTGEGYVARALMVSVHEASTYPVRLPL